MGYASPVNYDVVPKRATFAPSLSICFSELVILLNIITTL
jgi:hypothetical protein